MRPERVKTMEELATLSGISRPTLSKFFHDPNSVRPSTRERVERALQRYDYRPNVYAINQNRQLTRNIGIVVPFLADPFFAEVARTLEPMCARSGFNPILLSSHGDPKREVENLESLSVIRPAGVLLAPLGRRSQRDALEAFCEDVPTVLVDCDVSGVGDAFFGSDNMQSIGLMVDYLTRTGEPPAFLEMREAPNPNANKRRAAYEAAMRALGHTPMLLGIDGTGWNFEELAAEAAADLMRNRALPSNTILCSNDRLAIGVLSAAYEHGYRVGIGHGHALRVAGHDDHPYTRFSCPSLTTVAQDYASITGGSMAALLSIIETGVRPAQKASHVFEGTLIMRRSA